MPVGSKQTCVEQVGLVISGAVTETVVETKIPEAALVQVTVVVPVVLFA